MSPEERMSLIRKAIEEAVPAEEYLAEQKRLAQANPAQADSTDVYQAHLDALTTEYDALLGDEYLNEDEATSVRALVAFVAFNHNISEQAVCAIVEDHFRIDEIRKILRKDYEYAIKYLVDLEPKKMMN
jgi:hypothetical protein